MSHKIRDIGVSHQIGKYSDAVEVRPHLRWLFASGTPGLEIRGTIPAHITGQTELAWKHMFSVLEQANGSHRRDQSHTVFRPRRGYCRLGEGENSFLGDAEPASCGASFWSR
jgi:enamine deaminase RidA (YjgF/YER057c/UK114 family)